MSGFRFALAQINSTVGDLAGNSRLVISACHEAGKAGAQLVAFPEMALTGYPIEDLALRRSFQEATVAHATHIAQELQRDGLGDLAVVLGTLDVGAAAPRNAAAVIRDGEVATSYVKHRLPNYGVFDERRLFEAGNDACVLEVAGQRVSLAICEDLWYPDFPAQVAAQSQAIDLLLTINASPFESGKHDQRVELCRTRARELDVPVAYVASIGGQDELVFDGGTMVVLPDGTVAASSPRFADDLLVVDLPFSGAGIATSRECGDLEEIYEALTIGLRDYVRKNQMKSVVLGLSGGIDSALVAAIACDALSPENVYGIALPSRYSSQHSVEDAEDLAIRTGLSLRHVPIAAMFNAYQEMLLLNGLAEENLQARIRGTTLMAVSNAEGHLVLATGNKSELAVGYSTIYGDAVGGYAPIKDVPKTVVWELAEWRNEIAASRGETPPIPPRSISKPPSAELRPDQLDTDSLPEYSELDRIIERYVEARVSAADLIAEGYNAELAQRVIRMIDAAEYKRRQYPPGPKITRLAFGRDRRMPITNRWSEPGAGDA